MAAGATGVMWKGNEGVAGGAEIQGADEGGVYY